MELYKRPEQEKRVIKPIQLVTVASKNVLLLNKKRNTTFRSVLFIIMYILSSEKKRCTNSRYIVQLVMKVTTFFHEFAV
jgi:hypothetical protein